MARQRRRRTRAGVGAGRRAGAGTAAGPTARATATERPTTGSTATGSTAVDKGPWWRRFVQELGIPGVALVLFLGVWWAGVLVRTELLVDTVLSYRERGGSAEVKVLDGCLVYQHKRDGSRSGSTSSRHCAATRPEGLEVWAPQTRETYWVDRSGRRVTELVAFGMVPDTVVTVRYTLPGGHRVEVPTRRHEELDHPAYWVHLVGVSFPLDLRETGGEAVFTRFQMFDAAGREVPGV